jgi:hypothetical protein
LLAIHAIEIQQHCEVGQLDAALSELQAAYLAGGGVDPLGCLVLRLAGALAGSAKLVAESPPLDRRVRQTGAPHRFDSGAGSQNRSPSVR